MNRRHLLCSFFAVGAASCQHAPTLPKHAAPQPLSSATQQRLAKVGARDVSRVAAFAINRGKSYPTPADILVINGSLNPDHSPSGGATLNDEQVNRLLDATTVKDYPSLPARCFYPRHGFAFYNKAGQIVAQMTICFSCLGIRTDGIKGVQQPDYKSLTRLFRDLGVVVK